MKDFFANLYELFINIYGNELADHLYGTACDNGDVYGGQYAGIGLTMIVTSLILVVIYYYSFVNASRNRWYHWLYWLIGNFIISFLVGYYLPFRDLSADLVCENLTLLTEDTVFFGLVNGLFSIFFFLVFTFMLRWWSVDGRTTPYPN